MKLKLNYFVIPSVVFAIALLGKYFTDAGMAWYKTIQLPILTPPNWVFPIVWNIIFVMATAAALIAYNRLHNRRKIMSIFLINAALNCFWSYLFFYQHQIGLALLDAILLLLTIIVLIKLLNKQAPNVAYLLLPYGAWVSFAIYLNGHIWLLNR